MSRVDGSFRVYRVTEPVPRLDLVDFEAGRLDTADESVCPEDRQRAADGPTVA